MEGRKVVVEDRKVVVEDRKVVVEDCKDVVEGRKVVVEDRKVVVKDRKDVAEDCTVVVEGRKDVAEDHPVVVEDRTPVGEDHVPVSFPPPTFACAVSKPPSAIAPCPVSGPATGVTPLSVPVVPSLVPAEEDGDSEDDHLSQLFPDDAPEASGLEPRLFESDDVDAPRLEPLTALDAKEADKQNEAFAQLWRDQPLPAVPMVEIPFFVPLPDKSMKQVLCGLMSIHTEVKALGLPLHRIHSDRGREFINHKVAAWALHHGVAQTSTSGDDWKANGRVENWVRLLKRSTRTLLVAHDAPPAQWAFAMRHCAARLQAAALSTMGVPQPRLLPWRARLALRRRSWETKQPWASRVIKATVLCPSPVLRGGHLVITDDGSFVHTAALAEVAHVVELQEYEASPPTHRLRGKQPRVPPAASSAVAVLRPALSALSSAAPFSPSISESVSDHATPAPPRLCSDALGSSSRSVAVSQRGGGHAGGDTRDTCKGPVGILTVAAQPRKVPRKVRFDLDSHRISPAETLAILDTTQSEAMAQALGENDSVSATNVLALLQASGFGVPGEKLAPMNYKGADAWFFGACRNEDGFGVYPLTKDRPFLTQLLCNTMRASHPSSSFSALCVTRKGSQTCRRDLTGIKGQKNFLLPLSKFQGGHLWVEDDTIDDEQAIFRAIIEHPDRPLCRGRILSVRPCLAYDASRYHQVQETQGDRWILEGFTPAHKHPLLPKDREYLEELGFPLPAVLDQRLVPLAVRMSAVHVDSIGHPQDSGYECVGASHALSKCRVSVMKVLDCVQANLKKWVHEVRAFWGRANSEGEGDESADLLRGTELQICTLQETLQKARDGDMQECPPLLPEDQVKELACLVLDTPPEERLCVAHATADPSSRGSASSEVPLQTRTLTLGEVLAELEDWKPSWGEEYDSLVKTHEAVCPLDAEELQEWRDQGRKFQIIPSKLVHTLKAHTGRRKTRCVCCGNMEEVSLFNRHECYAGGVDATALRAALRVVSAWEWSISSFDVRTAFLQSRLLDKHDVPTVVKTPWLWRKHGICQEEYWLVKGALYGLCISPRSWCESRDATMAAAHTKMAGFQVSLRCFRSDPNLWWVIGRDPEDKEDNETQLGIVAWYIDDALILAQPAHAQAITEFIAGLWNTTPPEYLSPGQVLVYNGFEIEQDGACIRLHQKSFLTELLSRYPGHELADVPAVPYPPREEEEPNPDLTRKCQALCGELLWLSIRTRPELCYAVNMMAQRMARSPLEAWERGIQILKYLRRHPEIALSYGLPSSGDLCRATALSDASFAPNAERSHQCCLTLLGDSLITWHSCRQPFITQSTCEAELVALCSALSDLEAQLPLFKELLPSKEWSCELLCDNKSAVAICQAPFGSWRSRHLHLRANVIKERLSQGWSLRHQPGVEMLADLGTKPLALGRFLELMLGLGLHVPPTAAVQPQVRMVRSPTRPCSLDLGASDMFSVPAESRCQSLLRALILLELVGSLPTGESSSGGESTPFLSEDLRGICTAGSICLATLWLCQRHFLATCLATGLGLYFVIREMTWTSSQVPLSWLLVFSLGFMLGWACKDWVSLSLQRTSTGTQSPVDWQYPTLQEEAPVPELVREVGLLPTLWHAYGDDTVWAEDSSNFCFPLIRGSLALCDFARLQFVCRGLRGRVIPALRAEDRDRSLLSREEQDFANIEGAIARSLEQPASYDPTNLEVRRWVEEFRRAENQMLFGPDSEEEEGLYDPDEHVDFHAAAATYYLAHQGYEVDVEDVNVDFQTWYERILENPPPMDLSEDSNRIASAAAFLNFHGFVFDDSQFTAELHDMYLEHLGRQHIQEYRDS